MRSIVFILTLLVPLFTLSQNLPECDSVVIDCCSYNTYNPNTVDIEVSNYSNNIFSYPGFILFDLNMDTIAKETVNYYGIGWNQIHSLNIVQPIDLPFEGFLELHTGFYYSHLCTFPITIPDTVQTSIDSDELVDLVVYPNPIKDNFRLTFTTRKATHIKFSLFDIYGKKLRMLMDQEVRVGNHSIQLQTDGLASGYYFLHTAIDYYNTSNIVKILVID